MLAGRRQHSRRVCTSRQAAAACLRRCSGFAFFHQPSERACVGSCSSGGYSRGAPEDNLERLRWDAKELLRELAPRLPVERRTRRHNAQLPRVRCEPETPEQTSHDERDFRSLRPPVRVQLVDHQR